MNLLFHPTDLFVIVFYLPLEYRPINFANTYKEFPIWRYKALSNLIKMLRVVVVIRFSPGIGIVEKPDGGIAKKTDERVAKKTDGGAAKKTDVGVVKKTDGGEAKKSDGGVAKNVAKKTVN